MKQCERENLYILRIDWLSETDSTDSIRVGVGIVLRIQNRAMGRLNPARENTTGMNRVSPGELVQELDIQDLSGTQETDVNQRDGLEPSHPQISMELLLSE